MKKYTGFILLIILIAPFTGYYVALNLEKIEVRRTVKQQILSGINEKHLVRFTINSDDVSTKLNWIHAHEFEYDGQLYDVVRTESANGFTTLICFPDNKETALHKKIETLISNAMHHEQKDKEKKQFRKLFKQLYFTESVSCLKTIDNSLANIAASGWFCNYSGIVISPPAPPPKIG